MATPPLKRSRKSTTKRKEATVDINTLMFDVINGERKSLTELSNAELKAELIKCGEKPGPITDSTRKPYEKLLVRKLQNDQNDSTSKATTTITITGAKKTNASQNRSRASSSGVKRLTSKVFRPVIQGELNDGMKVSPSKSLRLISSFNFNNTTLTFIITNKNIYTSRELNLTLIPQYINLLLSDGITICHICSDAGEYKSLTIDERKAIVQEWARASQGKLQGIICNVSCDCLNAATELARFAQSVGVSAISCTCPSYGYKTRIATLTNYLSNISRDAPNIPLLYNHSEETIITSSTEPFSVLNLEEILNCIAFDVPTFCGTQYNGYNLCDYGLCKTSSVHSKNYFMIMGREEQFLGGLAVGCTIFQSHVYGYLGKLYNGIIDCFKLGNIHEARRLQGIVNAVHRKLGNEVTVHKAMLTLRGLDIGIPRSPLQELSGDMMTKLKTEMAQLGIFTTDTIMQPTINLY
ncbi:N-acetylneuraminate lyase [Trichoplax sp. H2]|nr:N-acetylneuraminate lyase [Trichoplax sp. H2]|eukprot:RDD46113.1 N-acetylneuraminate lyase [Trichoplax sp. H2]